MRKPTRNLMTIYTRTVLEKELRIAKEELNQAQLSVGEAAGRESNWHDNAAFDYANMDFDLKSARLASLEKKLRDVEIITPRQETDRVGIGNSVVIKFQNEMSEEKFTVLGPDDSGKKSEWLSYLSPLAKNLIGKKERETVKFSIGNKENYTVRIAKILPGEFE